MTTIIIVSLIIFSVFIMLTSHLFPYQIKTAAVVETLNLQTKINYSFFLVQKGFKCINNTTCAIVYLPKYVNLIVPDHADIGTLTSDVMKDYYNGLIFKHASTYLNIINKRQFCISVINVTSGATKYNVTISYVYRSGICTKIFENGTEVIAPEAKCVCKFPSTHGTGGPSYIFLYQTDPFGAIETSIFPEIVSKYGLKYCKNALIIGNFTINRSCVFFLLYNLSKNFSKGKPYACEFFAKNPGFSFCLARYILDKCAKQTPNHYSILVVPIGLNVTQYMKKTTSGVEFNNTTIPAFYINLTNNTLIYPSVEKCTWDISSKTIKCQFAYYVPTTKYSATLNTKFYPVGSEFQMEVDFDIVFDKKPYQIFFDGCPILDSSVCDPKKHTEVKGSVSCSIPLKYSFTCSQLKTYCTTTVTSCK